MSPNKKASGRNRIPIEFVDPEQENDISGESQAVNAPHDEDEPDEYVIPDEFADADVDSFDDDSEELSEFTSVAVGRDEVVSHPAQAGTGELGGPVLAELVATRAELKRVEAETADLKDRLARRQADFENYRKRVERERTDTYDRAVAEIAAKLLPVLDNLKRALDVESNVESTESDEFRHFLSGVDLIFKQLTGVLEALGVKPISAVGTRFDPHIHEAVVSESTDEYEPDTVMQEIIRGYRLGDKLIRPAMVKVAVKK
ncbi:MAG: nucleotide exchange factor GrpE [Pyrinomonadaceae bacterium]|nr:nucleotide exchange factor GrpE [Pyrinomonadaceae bacterium]